MILSLIFGILFGLTLQYAKLNRYNTISGLAMLKDFTVAKAIAIAIGVGIILINIEIGLGFASFHTKPFLLVGIILGGVIFGSGMAILGYCPGTLPVSLGEGSLDALLGIIGGLFGGFVYTIALPLIQKFLGPDLGNLTFINLFASGNFIYYITSFLVAILFIAIAFYLHKLEKTENLKWLYAGTALAVLNGIVFLNFTSDRIIGASTCYPYFADSLTGTTANDYFAKIKVAGSWELTFLFGAFIASLVNSLRKKDFKFVLMYDNWKKYKNDSSKSRILWSLIGGFILIFGARMAGGCTSGHILSGGMQLAVSSLVFAVFAFIGLLATGKIFYKKN
jgi:uncharacterized membrane protein YedE/YeeE